MKKISLSTIVIVLFPLILTHPADARVYRNKKVGTYESSFSLADHTGQSLLSFMKKNLYPAIKEESHNRSRMDHVDSIEVGEGVELRLTEDVSTYHVKYKRTGEDKAERSGRSFGAVGTGKRVDYLADASYKHFLSTLEKVLKDPQQSELFYKAILQIVINSDPRGIEILNEDTKKVAADFVAVYIAEQYRRLIEKDGKALAHRPEWDNAHFHVTLLANFHAGQKKAGMYYHGRYTTEVYHQIERSGGNEVCAYKDSKNPLVDDLDRRDFNLTDYWQFNAECERSGVNITRRDFEKMSGKITKALNNMGYKDDLSTIYELTSSQVETFKNINDSLVTFIVSDEAPEVYQNSEELIETLLNYINLTRENAEQITDSL